MGAKPSLRIAFTDNAEEAAAICKALERIGIASLAKDSIPPGRWKVDLTTAERAAPARDLVAGFRAGMRLGKDVKAFLTGVSSALVLKYGTTGDVAFRLAIDSFTSRAAAPAKTNGHEEAP